MLRSPAVKKVLSYEPDSEAYTWAGVTPEDTRLHKLARLEAGAKARVMDLFAGCGGMSLGFQRAGFELVGAVESDPIAAESHALNFFKSISESARQEHRLPRDITETPPELFFQHLGLGRPELGVDVLIGGPPCQAFARVGRAKLREIADHPQAFKKDSRADLYLSFITYIDRLQPLAIVMENVPDVINFGGHNIPEEMCETLEAKGYIARYTLLNSAFYGVPQMRERMFLIALAKEICGTVSFPAPTHRCEIPRGYEGSRQVALKHVGDLFAVAGHFVRPSEAGHELPKAVTAEDALGDLPPITLHLSGKLKRGARRFTELVPYPQTVHVSEFAKAMRTWPGYENEAGVYDHVIRSLPRDYPIFRRMKPGDQYPEAHALAMRMLDEAVVKRLGPRSTPTQRGGLKRQLKAGIVPPYAADKFPNKWRKMEADAPARTLMAHLGKDGYSHIHYDSSQARTISVREAARLQSFPDGFRFCGTMNPAFRQIGNAVPPLLAYAVARAVRDAISDSK